MSLNSIPEIARKAASLPRDFYAIGTMSIYDLLKQSGYFDAHEAIGESELAKEFLSQVELVTDWLSYSENKRGGDGWYIIFEGGKYVVGHLGRGEKVDYSDKVKAAAFFAKQELESIRKSE